MLLFAGLGNPGAKYAKYTAWFFGTR